MGELKRFYVYIMTNHPRSGVLYTGIAGDLRHRVWEHKNRVAVGFTSRYNLTRLVYYECFVYPDAAIAREKEIKGWLRRRKIELIEAMNPRWDDLAERWQDMFKPEPWLRHPEQSRFSGGAKDLPAHGSPGRRSFGPR